MMTLYGYWRSSAAYRVRIALNYKELTYNQKTVHLVNHGGEQHHNHYKKLNPFQLVPTFVDDEINLTQSLAIIDYIEEKYPKISLFPQQIKDKAMVKSMAMSIACDLHPLNNLRVLNYLKDELHIANQQKLQWYQHWVTTSFDAFETLLTLYAGKYCFGDTVSLADVCLIPQVYNAKRFAIEMSSYPLILAIYDRCNQHCAFINALPENQFDAP